MWLRILPPITTVIMIHIFFMSLPFACMNEPGNDLGADGAKALVPALTQMTQMTTLNLYSKSRMAHAHTSVSTG